MKLSKQVLSTLGLPEDATEEQVNQALLSRLEKPSPHESATPERPQIDLEALTQAIAKVVEPIRAELDAIKGESQESKEKVRDAQLHSILDAGVASFKVTPASRESLLEMGRAVGADKLRAHVDSLPSLAHLSQPVGRGDVRAQQDEKKLTTTEQDVAAKVGLSPDEMRKAKQVMREDGGRFKAGVSLTRRPKHDQDEDEAAA